MLNKITQYIKTEINPHITNINYWVILLIISGMLSIVFGSLSYFIITEIKDFALSIIPQLRNDYLKLPNAKGNDSIDQENLKMFFSFFHFPESKAVHFQHYLNVPQNV